MTSRAELVVELAPVAPPCFASRSLWLSYLQSAAEYARGEHRPGPIVLEAGKPPRFNFAYDVCEDCNAQHSFAMDRQGLCNPKYLADLGALLLVVHQAPVQLAVREAA